MKMMSSLNQVRAFGFIFGLLGLAYGIKERELRRRASAERAVRGIVEIDHPASLNEVVPAHQEFTR